MPALDRVIALLADPTRPAGTDRAAQRPKLAELVNHATQNAVPLAPGTEPGQSPAGVLTAEARCWRWRTHQGRSG